MTTDQAAIKRPGLRDQRLVRADPIRRQAVVELACMVIGVETIMWVVPLVPAMRAAYLGMVLMILALLATCHIRDSVSARRLGFRLDNLFGALGRLALPLGAFILVVVAIGYGGGTLRFGAKFYSMLAFVPVWALVQQYMLLAFANRRFRAMLGEGNKSAIATAALFSLLHLPNPVLTVACAFGGYVWAREYERTPNLFATSLTHAVASAFLANSLPGWLLKNMVVGYNFFFR